MMKGPLDLGNPKASLDKPPTLGTASARNNAAYNSVKNMLGNTNRMTR